MRVAAFSSPTTSCLMGVNLSSIRCSRLFGCYNFSSVSCCKTHWLRLYPGLHHSCETLISGTHSPITALADACCLVSSPAGSWLLFWCSPGTANNCGTLVNLETGCCAAPWVALHVLYLFPLISLNLGRICHQGVWESKLSCDFVILNLGFETGLFIIFSVCECVLHTFFAEPCVLPAKWFINYGI